MALLTLVQSKSSPAAPLLAPDVPPAQTALNAAQRAKVNRAATRIAAQFRIAAIDYFERWASYGAVISAHRSEGVLDGFLDPILDEATLERVLLDVQSRALDHMRQRLRHEAETLLKLADAPHP